MSDEQKQANETFELPKPVFPQMEMPQAPQVSDDKKDDQHVSCEGEVYKPELSNPAIVAPEKGRPRILIGIPILSYSHEFVQSFMKFWTQLCLAHDEFQAGYHFVYRKPVHMAEQVIFDTAVYNKCTHILFIDDDIYDYSIDDLRKLLAADKDVIGGVMYASKFPYAMCVFRRYDTTKKVIDMPSDNSMYRLYEIPCLCHKCGFGLSHWDIKFCPVCSAPQDNIIQKADLIPFCFTLMKVETLQKMKKPVFHCEIEYPSDSWFGDRCIEAGVQEWAHMGVRLNHNGVNDLTKPHLFQMELQKKQVSGNAGVVNITQEDMKRHEYLLHTKMKEAEEKVKGLDKPMFINEETTDDSKKSDIKEAVPQEQSAEVPS